MTIWWRVAAAEATAWWRSRLARAAALLLLGLVLATTVLTTLRMQAAGHERLQHQRQADETFLAQPDRHPHRMVHYGHYVFRTPTPLAAFDPGLDPVTGQSIFLEGHRQNTAMFAPAGAAADLGAAGWLSPALVVQWFGPLLLILLGHGLFAREREAGTLAALLAQGVGGRPLLAGKALALAGGALVLMLPLAAAAGLAVVQGERPSAALALWVAYLLYLLVWVGLVLLVSALLAQRRAVLTALLSLWIGLTLLLPALAVSSAALLAPAAGKLEADLQMLAEARRLGDGHNANDPAFARLRADLLARHGVERPEELPVNLRGVVAQAAEARLTETLNEHARRRMAAETRQAEVLSRHGWIAPVLALADASRAIAGTDLRHHHRFLQQAEALRYDFVQGLNRIHAEQLAYADDIRRSSDPEAERRTRVDASNWQLLARFRFEPDAAGARVAAALPQALMLAAWLGVLAVALVWAGGRIRP